MSEVRLAHNHARKFFEIIGLTRWILIITAYHPIRHQLPPQLQDWPSNVGKATPHIKIFEIQILDFKISSLAPNISSEIENFLPDYLAICNVSGENPRKYSSVFSCSGVAALAREVIRNLHKNKISRFDYKKQLIN